MEAIIKFFLEAFKALLALFGKELPEMGEETKDNLENMYDNIAGFDPLA